MAEDAIVTLDRIIRRLPNDLQLVQQGFATEIFNEMQTGRRHSPGTPIDTGFARANWDGGPGSQAPRPADITAEEAKANPSRGRQAAQRRANEAAQAIQQVALGDPIAVWNTAPYIRRLEFGWSQQAPRGFIRLTLRAAQRIMNEVATHVARLRGRL